MRPSGQKQSGQAALQFQPLLLPQQLARVGTVTRATESKSMLMCVFERVCSFKRPDERVRVSAISGKTDVCKERAAPQSCLLTGCF